MISDSEDATSFNGDSTEIENSFEEEEQEQVAAPHRSLRLSGQTPLLCPVQALVAGQQVGGHLTPLKHISGCG